MALKNSEIVIYDSKGKEFLTVLKEDGSTISANLMESDNLTLKFSTEKPYRLHRGYYVVIPSFFINGESKKYVVCSQINPTYNTETGCYDYQVEFAAWYMAWDRYMLSLNPMFGAVQSSFSLTDYIQKHIQLIVTQLHQAAYKDGDKTIDLPKKIAIHYNGHDDEYTIDTTNGMLVLLSSKETPLVSGTSNESAYLVENKIKGVQYENATILSAISNICAEEAFNCEWWVTDDSTLHFGRCEYGTQITFERGKELSAIQRSDSSNEYGTRLVAFGAKTNIPARYRKSLILDANSIEHFEHEQKYSLTTDSIYTRVKSDRQGNVFISSTICRFNALSMNVEFKGNLDFRAFPIADTQVIGNWTMFVYAIVRGDRIMIGQAKEDKIVIDGYIQCDADDDVEIVADYQGTIAPIEYGYSVEGYFDLYIYSSMILCEEDSWYEYRFRDSFRKMIPEYFDTMEETESTISNTYATSTLNKQSDTIVKDKNNRYIDAGYMENTGITKVSVEFDWRTAGELYYESGPNVKFSVSIDVIGDTTEHYPNVMETTVAWNSSYLSTKNVSMEGQFVNKTKGQVRFFITYTQELMRYNPVCGDISVSASCSSFIAKTTVTCVSGAMKGRTFNAIVNKNNALYKSDDASWMYIESKDSGILNSMKGNQFTLSNVIEPSVPVSFFTDDYDNDTTLSSYERRLMLPVSRYPKNYIDSKRIKDENGNTIQSEVVTIIKTFDDIYPSEEFSIAKVGTYMEDVELFDDDNTPYHEKRTRYRFYLKKSDLTFKKSYITNGETLRCIFQTGKLAGFTFDLEFDGNDVDQTLQTYKIINFDSYGVDIPNSNIQPEVGDKIVLINYNPTSLTDMGFITRAENRLADAAEAYLDKISLDAGTYQSTLYSDVAEKRAKESTPLLFIGNKIGLIDDALFDGVRNTRVIGYTINLDIPYDSPQFTFGESLKYSRFKAIEREISKS